MAVTKKKVSRKKVAVKKPSLFAKAASNAKKPVKKSAKSKVPEVDMENLDDLAAVVVAMKALDTIKSTLEAGLKDEMRSRFIEEGMAIQRRPGNFRGVDTVSSASCELKKKSTRSTLTDSSVELLEQFDVPYATIDDVTTTFLINPAYINDEDLMQRVSDALSEVEDLPEDLIEMQQGVSRNVTSDESLDGVFKSDATPAQVEVLLDIVSTMSIKPKYTGGQVAAFDMVRLLLEDSEE